ncbi:SAC3/GANP/THP3 protein, partial [Kipferlia bialata]
KEPRHPPRLDTVCGPALTHSPYPYSHTSISDVLATNHTTTTDRPRGHKARPLPPSASPQHRAKARAGSGGKGRARGDGDLLMSTTHGGEIGYDSRHQTALVGTSTDLDRVHMRSTDLLRPDEVRPEAVLRASFAQLKSQISARTTAIAPHFPTKDTPNPQLDPAYIRARDRLRAIRVDIRVQSIANGFALEVHCFHMVIAARAGDLPEMCQLYATISDLFSALSGKVAPWRWAAMACLRSLAAVVLNTPEQVLATKYGRYTARLMALMAADMPVLPGPPGPMVREIQPLFSHICERRRERRAETLQLLVNPRLRDTLGQRLCDELVYAAPATWHNP